MRVDSSARGPEPRTWMALTTVPSRLQDRPSKEKRRDKSRAAHDCTEKGALQLEAADEAP